MSIEMTSSPVNVAILKDGLAVAVMPESATLAWFHREQGQSMDCALEFGGYAVETKPELVAGWQAFTLYAARTGYGVNGSMARLAVEIDRLVTEFEMTTESRGFGEWRDWVAAPGIVAMLAGFVRLLDSTERGTFENIRGPLSSWAIATAARIGETEELGLA